MHWMHGTPHRIEEFEVPELTIGSIHNQQT